MKRRIAKRKAQRLERLSRRFDRYAKDGFCRQYFAQLVVATLFAAGSLMSLVSAWRKLDQQEAIMFIVAVVLGLALIVACVRAMRNADMKRSQLAKESLLILWACGVVPRDGRIERYDGKEITDRSVKDAVHHVLEFGKVAHPGLVNDLLSIQTADELLAESRPK